MSTVAAAAVAAAAVAVVAAASVAFSTSVAVAVAVCGSQRASSPPSRNQTGRERACQRKRIERWLLASGWRRRPYVVVVRKNERTSVTRAFAAAADCRTSEAAVVVEERNGRQASGGLACLRAALIAGKWWRCVQNWTLYVHNTNSIVRQSRTLSCVSSPLRSSAKNLPSRTN